MFLGYQSTGTLGPIINGGGLVSMIEVVFIVALSSTYSGIFSGTNMLEVLQDRIKPIIAKIGRFGGMIVVTMATLCIFCNQPIASMMCNDILKKPYEEAGASKAVSYTHLMRQNHPSALLLLLHIRLFLTYQKV